MTPTCCPVSLWVLLPSLCLPVWAAVFIPRLKKVISESGVDPKDIYGISFCSQMQGLVLVDKDGNHVRR
ncbi:MAG: hypothetical protein IIX49_00210, partial [Oscillospiraceae bacterium]|nr:hypothetical protein [Oscillospiraceae bacterium]